MKFKDVAHLYIGCRIVEKDGTLRLLTGSFHHYQMTGIDFEPFEGWKPILRRLDDLAEAHEKELGETSGLSPYRTAGCPKRWLKLLSWGYDLFGLIDAGEAIDAKTLEAANG